MLARFLAVLFALGLTFPAFADSARPVSVQELSLLLRSGYSGDEVLRETAGRPLLEPLDAAAEKALRDAGADSATIEKLRAGRAVASAGDAEAARQAQAATEQHKFDAWAASQHQQLEANRQAANAKLAARAEEEQKTLATHFQNLLVVLRDGKLQPYDKEALAGKRVWLFYVAALRSADCHIVAPALVKFYQEWAPKHPEFEVVLISADRSAYDMETAMRQDGMPWPAVTWERVAMEPDLAQMAKHGVPHVVLVDGAGKIVVDSNNGGKFDLKRVLEAVVRR